MAITTDAQVKALKLADGQKGKKETIGGGLYVFVNKSGKYWRYSYRYDGKTKDYSIGTYPAVSLKDAKAALAEPKALLKQGIDPNQHKREKKQASKIATAAAKAQVIDAGNTLQVIGNEWFENVRLGWHAGKDKVRSSYNRGEYIDQRTIMIQTFGDWLDGLRDGADIIPIGRKA